MYYDGKNLNLREYIEENKKDYIGLPDWRWEDEGLIWAIQSYHSSCNFLPEDIETLKEYGFTPEDFED